MGAAIVGEKVWVSTDKRICGSQLRDPAGASAEFRQAPAVRGGGNQALKAQTYVRLPSASQPALGVAAPAADQVAFGVHRTADDGRAYADWGDIVVRPNGSRPDVAADYEDCGSHIRASFFSDRLH